jgi:hypothetical protein
MTAEQIESFRICILQQLGVVPDGSLPVPTLVRGANLAGFREANADTVRSALAYLADKQLVAIVAKAVSPENKRWRITAAGSDYLAEAGL